MSQLSHTDAVLDRVLTRIVSAGNTRSQGGRSPARSIGSAFQQRDLSTGRCVSGVDKRRAGAAAKLPNSHRPTTATYGGASSRDSSLAGTTASVVPQLVFSRSILHGSGSLQLQGPATASNVATPATAASSTATTHATPGCTSSAAPGVTAPANAILRQRAQQQQQQHTTPQQRLQASTAANHAVKAGGGARNSPNSRRQHEGFGGKSDGGCGATSQAILRSGGAGVASPAEVDHSHHGNARDVSPGLPANRSAAGAAQPHALSHASGAAEPHGDAAQSNVGADCEAGGGARRGGGRSSNTITRTAALRALKQQRSTTPERIAEARAAAEPGSTEAKLPAACPPLADSAAGGTAAAAGVAAGSGGVGGGPMVAAAGPASNLRAAAPVTGANAVAAALMPHPSYVHGAAVTAASDAAQATEVQTCNASVHPHGGDQSAAVMGDTSELEAFASALAADDLVQIGSQQGSRSRRTSSASSKGAATGHIPGYAATAATRVALLSGVAGWGRGVEDRSPSPRRGTSSTAGAWPAGGAGSAASAVVQRQQRAMRQHLQRQTSPSPGRGPVTARSGATAVAAAASGGRGRPSLSPPPQRPTAVEPRQQRQQEQPQQQQEVEVNGNGGAATASQSRIRRLEEQVVALSAQLSDLQSNRADLEFEAQEEQQQQARNAAGQPLPALSAPHGDAGKEGAPTLGASTPREVQHNQQPQAQPQLLDQIKEIMDRETDLKQQLTRARATNETLASQNRTLYGTLEETLSAAEQAAQELKQLRTAHTALQADYDAAKASAAQLTEELGLRDRALAAVQAEFSSLRRRHEESQAAAEAARRDGALREARLRRELEAASQEAATALAALAKLQREHQQLHSRKGDRDRQLAALAKKAEAQQEQLATAARVAQESAALVRELESRATLLRTRNTALDKAVAAEKEARQAAQEQVRQMEEEIALLVAIVRQSDPTLDTLVRYKSDPAAAAALAASAAAAAAEALLQVSPSPDSGSAAAAAFAALQTGSCGDTGTSAGSCSLVVASSTSEPAGGVTGPAAGALTTAGGEDGVPRLGSHGEGHAVVTIIPSGMGGGGVADGIGGAWAAHQHQGPPLPRTVSSRAASAATMPATASFALRSILHLQPALTALHVGSSLSLPTSQAGAPDHTPSSEEVNPAKLTHTYGTSSSRDGSPSVMPYPAKHGMTGGLFLGTASLGRTRRAASPSPQPPRSTGGRSKSVGGCEAGQGYRSRRGPEQRAVSTGGRRERTPPGRAIAGARMRPRSDLGSRPGHAGDLGAGAAAAAGGTVRGVANRPAASGGGGRGGGGAVPRSGMGGGSSSAAGGNGAMTQRSSTTPGATRARSHYGTGDGDMAVAAAAANAFSVAAMEAAAAVSEGGGEHRSGTSAAASPRLCQQHDESEAVAEAVFAACDSAAPSGASHASNGGSPSPSSPLMAVPVSQGDRVLWAQPRRNRGSASCGGASSAAAARPGPERTYAALGARRHVDALALAVGCGRSAGGALEAVGSEHMGERRRARTPEPRTVACWARHDGSSNTLPRKRASTPGARISSTGRGAYILGGPAPINASIKAAKPRYSESAVELAALLLPGTHSAPLGTLEEETKAASPGGLELARCEQQPMCDTDLLPLSLVAGASASASKPRSNAGRSGLGTDMSQSLGLDEDSRTEMASPLKLARAYYEQGGGLRAAGSSRNGEGEGEEASRGDAAAGGGGRRSSGEQVGSKSGSSGAAVRCSGSGSGNSSAPRVTPGRTPEVFRHSYAFDVTPQHLQQPGGGQDEEEEEEARQRVHAVLLPSSSPSAAPVVSEPLMPPRCTAASAPAAATTPGRAATAAAGGPFNSTASDRVDDDALGAALRSLQLRQAQLLQELAATHLPGSPGAASAAAAAVAAALAGEEDVATTSAPALVTLPGRQDLTSSAETAAAGLAVHLADAADADAALLPVVASFSFPMTQPQRCQSPRQSAVEDSSEETCRSSGGSSSLREQHSDSSSTSNHNWSKKRTARRRSVTFVDDVPVDHPAAAVTAAPVSPREQHAAPPLSPRDCGGGASVPLASPRGAPGWRAGHQAQETPHVTSAAPDAAAVPRSPSKSLMGAPPPPQQQRPQSPMRSPRRPSVTAAAEAAAAAGAGVGGPLTALLDQLESGSNTWRTASMDRGGAAVAVSSTAAAPAAAGAAPPPPPLQRQPLPGASLALHGNEAPPLPSPESSGFDSDGPRKTRRTADQDHPHASSGGGGGCSGPTLGEEEEVPYSEDFAAGDDELISEEGLPSNDHAEEDDWYEKEEVGCDAAAAGGMASQAWNATSGRGIGTTAGAYSERDRGAAEPSEPGTASVRTSLADQPTCSSDGPDDYGAAIPGPRDSTARLGVSLYDNDVFDVSDMPPETLLAVSLDLCESMDSSAAPFRRGTQQQQHSQAADAAAAAQGQLPATPLGRADSGGNSNDSIQGDGGLSSGGGDDDDYDYEEGTEDGAAFPEGESPQRCSGGVPSRDQGDAATPLPTLRLSTAASGAAALREGAVGDPDFQSHGEFERSSMPAAPRESVDPEARWPNSRSEGLFSSVASRAESSLLERQPQLLGSLSRSSLSPMAPGMSSSLSMSSGGGSSSGDWTLPRRPPSPSVKPLSLSDVLRRPPNSSR